MIPYVNLVKLKHISQSPLLCIVLGQNWLNTSLHKTWGRVTKSHYSQEYSGLIRIRFQLSSLFPALGQLFLTTANPIAQKWAHPSTILLTTDRKRQRHKTTFYTPFHQLHYMVLFWLQDILASQIPLKALTCVPTLVFEGRLLLVTLQ